MSKRFRKYRIVSYRINQKVGTGKLHRFYHHYRQHHKLQPQDKNQNQRYFHPHHHLRDTGSVDGNLTFSVKLGHIESWNLNLFKVFNGKIILQYFCTGYVLGLIHNEWEENDLDWFIDSEFLWSFHKINTTNSSPSRNIEVPMLSFGLRKLLLPILFCCARCIYFVLCLMSGWFTQISFFWKVTTHNKSRLLKGDMLMTRENYEYLIIVD